MQVASVATRAAIRNTFKRCWTNAELISSLKGTGPNARLPTRLQCTSSVQSLAKATPAGFQQVRSLTQANLQEKDIGALKNCDSLEVLEAFRNALASQANTTSLIYEELQSRNLLKDLSLEDFTALRTYLWNKKAWGSEETVEEVLQDQKNCGHPWTVLEYNEYYMSLLFQAKYDAVLSNFEQEFSATDIKPTVATINSVLAAYIELNQLDKARALLSRCSQWELTPTVQDFQRLAHRCLPRNTKVVKTAQTIITDNALKDPRAMNRHLQNLFKANKLTEVQRLYAMLKVNPDGVDISTYSTLLKGYIDKRKYDEVNTLYNNICSTGRQLNSYVASLMLEAYAAQRDKMQLATLVQKMQTDRVPIDIALYNQLIKSFLATRQVGHAFTVFQQLQKDPCAQVNDIVLNTMIHGLLNNREIDAAKALYSQMQNSKIQPDMITYNTLLKGLTKARDFTGALTVLTDLYERSLEPDIVTYTTLIDAIFENLNPTSTEQILGLFSNSGVMKPNIFTYNVLINGWIRHNNISEAERTFNDLLASGDTQPTVHTYTNIIQGYIQNADLPKAMNTFRMMLQNGVQPGRATYHFIISGLINDGRLVDAVECLKKMRENGKMPTKDTWFMILNACADAKKWQLGSQVLKELDESKFEVRSDALLRVYRLVSQRIQSLSKNVIRRVWKINLQSSTESLFRVQFRGALITLEAISTKLPPLEPHRRTPPSVNATPSPAQSFYSRLGNGSTLSMRTTETGPLRITLGTRHDGPATTLSDDPDLPQYVDSLEASPVTPHDSGHNFWSSPSAEGSDDHDDTTPDPLMDETSHHEHPALAQFKAMAGSLIEEECLHQRIIRGIVSHTHRYVLIEDIDTRNRLRAAVDTIFHHVVFVSSGTHREDRWSRASAAAFVRLLKRLDTAFPNHGNEMTYTLSDNLKAFLEYSTYRLMASKRCGHHLWAIRTLDTLSSCANLVGAALLVKILTEPQVEGTIRKMCELLKDNQIPTQIVSPSIQIYVPYFSKR
ncbi:unnamed protein product [Umbelopsis vinacea]